MTENGKREPGEITRVFVGREDHEIDTVTVEVDFSTSTQVFGGLALDKSSQKSFVAKLCDAFGVRNVNALVHAECYALRCWGTFNDQIVGLESKKTGKRFTITSWQKSEGLYTCSPLEWKRDNLRSTIEWAKRRVREAEEALAAVEDGYTEWE